MHRKNRVITHKAASDIKRFRAHTLDPLTLEPNDLCDRTRDALSTLAEEDRKPRRDEILAGLRQAGVNIASALLLLGIPARTTDELTPSDVGKLLRYVRINVPVAMQALSGPLAQLLCRSAEPALTFQKAREAA